jgi:hypothetical protein
MNVMSLDIAVFESVTTCRGKIKMLSLSSGYLVVNYGREIMYQRTTVLLQLKFVSFIATSTYLLSNFKKINIPHLLGRYEVVIHQ